MLSSPRSLSRADVNKAKTTTDKQHLDFVIERLAAWNILGIGINSVFRKITTQLRGVLICSRGGDTPIADSVLHEIYL